MDITIHGVNKVTKTAHKQTNPDGTEVWVTELVIRTDDGEKVVMTLFSDDKVPVEKGARWSHLG